MSLQSQSRPYLESSFARFKFYTTIFEERTRLKRLKHSLKIKIKNFEIVFFIHG